MSATYTTNMACALYLVQKGNTLSGLEMYVDLPYAHEECRFAFDGERAEDDYRYYTSHNMSDLDLSLLPLLFRAVEELLPVREVAR